MKSVKKVIPRGIRNCNPLNIRIGNTWLGEVQNPDETAFEQFVSMEYGIRAGFVILRRYIRRYKRNTPKLIIQSWAPATENATEKYIDYVCKHAGLNPDDVIKFEDRDTLVRMVAAMIQYECGRPVSNEIIIKGYTMA